MTQGTSKTSCRAVYEKFKDGTAKDISDELPFEVPNGWAWVRWKDISLSVQYGYSAPASPTGRIKMVRITDIQDNRIIWDLVPYCQIDEASIDKYLLAAGDILFARTGGTVGKSHLVTSIPEAAVYAGYLVRTRCSDSILPQYAKVFLESDFYWQQLRAGIVATAQPNFNGEKLSSMLLPLPPLAEQKRIVAKIENLMPLVEEYGKMEETRLQLDADLPAMLEKSILQEAIQGKLVPQDPNDEPASELLKRIAAERKALVKAGKLKRDKSESVIFRGSDRLAYETRNGETVCIQDEIPFEIPGSWEWVRLGNITTFLHRGKSPTYVPHSGCPMFAQKCNQWDGIHLEKCKFCDEAKYKTFQDEYHLRDYDVVVNSTGTGTLGRVGIFHDSELAKHGYLSIVPDSHVTVVRTSLHDLSQYIYHYLCTKFCWEWMNNNADGSTKQKELYTSTLASLLIPIPPLAEQRRIASAIPLLLNNCNQLKQQPTM